jgi:hypothetical protein
MLKFVLGVLLGAVMAFGYVRWNVQLPAILLLPEKLRGNIISTAAEADLYDLERGAEVRRRALEVLFANRPDYAARLDAEAGHPFLSALHRERAVREARQILIQWSAYQEVLAKPALRGALERKHGSSDPQVLKSAMLREALDKQPFLKSWLVRHTGAIVDDNLRATLSRIGAGGLAPGAERRP